jgi:5-formyltetrahydrofolate cyclo-ligase
MSAGNESLRAVKSALRREIRAGVAAMSEEARTAESAAVCRALLKMPIWKQAGVILAYAPMPGELDIKPMLAAALRADKRVYLPRVAGNDISFLRSSGREDELEPHRFGMSEPALDAPEWTPSATAPALIVCPGLAFDRNGRRLGRGKGYYDRFLAGARSRVRRAGPRAAPLHIVGVCFSAQLVDEVPTGPADQRVDLVVTPAGVLGPG